MNTQQKDTHVSEKIEKRQSLIHGIGIFAKEHIAKGEVIAIKGGVIYSSSDFTQLDIKIKEFCLQIDDEFFIGPTSISEIEQNAAHVNHSCNPNLAISGQVIGIAMRDIDKDEEITHDYASSFTNMQGFGDFICSCGASVCRKKIRGDDWEKKELQEMYGKYFSNYILNKINN